jgi:hypothetical protein
VDIVAALAIDGGVEPVSPTAIKAWSSVFMLSSRMHVRPHLRMHRYLKPQRYTQIIATQSHSTVLSPTDIGEIGYKLLTSYIKRKTGNSLGPPFRQFNGLEV